MAESRNDTLKGIINELKDRITAEPANTDLPPLLAQAESELTAIEAADKAAADAAKAAQVVSAAQTPPAMPPVPTTAAAQATSDPAATVAAAAAVAATAAPAPKAPRVRPAPPLAAAGLMPARVTRPTMIAGNVTVDTHPSRLPPAARPTKN